MKLFSEDTLAHYGIEGMKKGVRRWQYPDGRFNEEGKERYFGKSENEITKQRESSNPDSKYTIGKGLKYVMEKTIPFTTTKNINENAKRLGREESIVKSFIKAYTFNSQDFADNYNIYRSEGNSRMSSYFKSLGDHYENLMTLGKHNYDRQENRGLKHSNS